MALLTLLPIGLIQLSGALEHGYWYARSAELMQKPIIQLLVWMRVPGDTIFSVGALSLAWFVLRLWIAPQAIAALSHAAMRPDECQRREDVTASHADLPGRRRAPAGRGAAPPAVPRRRDQRARWP